MCLNARKFSFNVRPSIAAAKLPLLPFDGVRYQRYQSVLSVQWQIGDSIIQKIFVLDHYLGDDG